MGGWEEVTAAGEVVKKGSTRDGDFDSERYGEGCMCAGEKEDEGSIKVGGEEVGAGFVRYFCFDLAATFNATTTICAWLLVFGRVVFATSAEILVSEVRHMWCLSIAALELGDQLVFFPQVFPHDFIEQCFGQLRRIVYLVKIHEGLSEEEGRRGSRRCRSGIGCGDWSIGGRERGGGRPHFVLVAFTPGSMATAASGAMAGAWHNFY
jgi:hypothetical protein